MRTYLFTVLLLSLVSCNNKKTPVSKEVVQSNDNEKRKNLELREREVALKEREAKLNKNEKDKKNSKNIDSESKTYFIPKPSLNDQETVIYQFYDAFDNAYDRGSMNSYISRYYSGDLQSKYYKTELPSFDAYQSKYHNIQSISMISESNESRSYRVEFYFEYTKSNGKSASVLCADILTLDNNNKIVARNEIGKIG